MQFLTLTAKGLNMNEWHTLYITDKTGKKFFNTTASPMSTMSEIRNLKRHIEQAKARPNLYANLFDVATAVIMLDDVPYSEPEDMSDDDLLKELGL